MANLRTLCMLGAGALAVFGLASCNHPKDVEPEVEVQVDNSEIYEKLQNLKPTVKLQTNPLEKQGNSYYV